MSLHDYIEETPQVQVMPFNPGHLARMKVDDSYFKAVAPHVQIEDALSIQASKGVAYTAFLHGRPAAVFGSVAIWKGVEELWLLIEERGRTYGKTLTRIAQGMVAFRVIDGNLHRLQITVRCEDVRAVRWAKVIGFNIDGKMPRFGADGSDFYMMSKV